jgi:hypothetical protein
VEWQSTVEYKLQILTVILANIAKDSLALFDPASEADKRSDPPAEGESVEAGGNGCEDWDEWRAGPKGTDDRREGRKREEESHERNETDREDELE